MSLAEHAVGKAVQLAIVKRKSKPDEDTIDVDRNERWYHGKFLLERRCPRCGAVWYVLPLNEEAL